MNWWRRNGRLGRALAASLALHAAAAFLFPRLAATPEPGPAVIEKISFQKIARVSVSAPRTAARAAAAPAKRREPPRALHVRPARIQHKAPPARPKARSAVIPTPGAASAGPLATLAVTAVPERAASQRAQASAVATVATAAPKAHASARPSAAPESGGGRALTASGGQQPFLAEQPPALETGALQELRHRFRMRATLIVEVTDDGKVKNVRLRPPASADVQRQIHDLLAQAHWDPAVCPTGLTCDGTWTLDLAQ